MVVVVTTSCEAVHLGRLFGFWDTPGGQHLGGGAGDAVPRQGLDTARVGIGRAARIRVSWAVHLCPKGKNPARKASLGGGPAGRVPTNRCPSYWTLVRLSKITSPTSARSSFRARTAAPCVARRMN